MSTPHFHPLLVKRIDTLTAQAMAITLAIPENLQATFGFKPGQFVTLRAMVGGQSIRRSYSICSAPARLAQRGEISVGIKRVHGGVFSSWATTALQAGDALDAMPPDGRFTPRHAQPGLHRLAIAAGSGITPILSIMGHTLATQPASHFTLIYGNQRSNSIMFSEALQDLKDQYPQRVSLVHVLSRQTQESALLSGRLDEAKISALLAATVPVQQISEVFVCGPEPMIEAAERALQQAGVAREQVHSERFASTHSSAAQQPPVLGTVKATPESIANYPMDTPASSLKSIQHTLEVVLDGKTHHYAMGAQDKVLDTALDGGLDLPYACKGGVCCTCRAKVLDGKVLMDKNFTLEQWEIDKGFVLTCQARCVSSRVVVSFDER